VHKKKNLTPQAFSSLLAFKKPRAYLYQYGGLPDFLHKISIYILAQHHPKEEDFLYKFHILTLLRFLFFIR